MSATGIGDRLREVRKGMKLSQAAFGELGGVGKRAQIYYEQGENEPGSSYWQRLHAAGIDFAYIVSGVPGARTIHESYLLTKFREAPAEVKDAVLRALAIPVANTSLPRLTIGGGKQGQVVAGDVSQNKAIFHVGSKKKGAGK